MTWTPPVLETERLILRPVSEADAGALFEYAKDPAVSKFTLWEAHRSVEDSLNFIKNYVLPYYEKGVPEPFGIELKERPGILVGTVGCFFVAGQAKSMELAYALSKSLWGQGLMPEAARSIMDYCFDSFDIVRLQCRCKAENAGSFRVMEKLGMKYEGTLRSSVFHRDRFWDMKHYSVLRNERSQSS